MRSAPTHSKEKEEKRWEGVFVKRLYTTVRWYGRWCLRVQGPLWVSQHMAFLRREEQLYRRQLGRFGTVQGSKLLL